MVAMLGPIIAAPLAIPMIVYSMPPMVTLRPDILCTVSVVNMPFAAESRQASLVPSLTAAEEMPCSILSIGKNCPMTPVESTSASSSFAPHAAAAMRAISTASRRPRSPVQALATPEQITTQRIAAGRAAAVELHRCGTDQILRVNARRGGRHVGHHQRQVRLLRIPLDAAMHAGHRITLRNADRHGRKDSL